MNESVEKITLVERRARLAIAAKELEWLDRETAAAYMSISLSVLDRISRALKPSKLGRRTIYKKSRINEYMDRCAGISVSLSNPAQQ